MTWARELDMGARLALAGGKDGWLRAAMTAVAVGLGVALLLVAASVPAMLDARSARGDARSIPLLEVERPATNTLLVAESDTRFREEPITGVFVQPEGGDAPVPPGVVALPEPGQLVVSPALAELLASPEGALLRPRLSYPIVGTIGDEGLAGPNQYAFYLGSNQLDQSDVARRIDHFGEFSEGEGLGPVLLLLVIIGFVVLLLPIAVFIAVAVRFGGEHRDRRLAALRLAGADSRMTRRIAAGEALLGTVLGVAAGGGFFVAGRQLVEPITLWDISVFAGDLRPSAPLAALILLAVPASAVVVTLLALRGVVIEPLGVVRRSGGGRRRVWWRLILPVIGLALLYPLVGEVDERGSTFNEYQVTSGVVLLLIGVAALLPWLIEAVVRRLGGGGVSWQLGIRRLQLNSGASARVVNGIAVAASGAIALQMLFTGIEGAYTENTGEDPSRAQLQASIGSSAGGPRAEDLTATFRATAGVRSVATVTEAEATLARVIPGQEGTPFPLLVGDCAALRELATLDRCAEGDVFRVEPGGPTAGTARLPAPGERFVQAEHATGPQWTMPAGARTAKPRQSRSGVFATPSAVSPTALRDARILTYLRLDGARPDAAENVRNAAAGIDPLMRVATLEATTQVNKFANIRRGIFIGAVATLLLIGASLLVTTLEQLQDRRRLLAVLVAFGTRRATLGWSVLWQTAVPVALGLALATAAGAGLGAVLLAMVQRPVSFDWQSIAAISAAGAGVVLLVTVLSLPALWRMMRPQALRSE